MIRRREVASGFWLDSQKFDLTVAESGAAPSRIHFSARKEPKFRAGLRAHVLAAGRPLGVPAG